MPTPCDERQRATTGPRAGAAGASGAADLTASLICRSSPAPAPPNRVSALSALIARVEPLTTTRRLSGPFDYRVDHDVADRLDRADPVRPPEARRRRGRARGDDRRPRREARRADVASASDSLPRDLVDLALWMAEEYCSTPARALALVTPPPGKAKTYLWAEPTGRRRPAQRQPARAARAAPGPDGRRPPGAAAARGARAGDDHAPRRAAGAADEPRARPRGRAHRGADRRAARRSRPRPARRGCCTA